MFKIICAAFILSLAVLPSYSVEVKPKSDLTCELCTLVLTAAQTLIAKNETEDKIIGFIEKNLCGRLGGLNGTCVQFMESEGRQVLYELGQGIHPSIVCHKFGLCNAKMNFPRASLNCTVCKLVMGQVKNMLNSNASEAQLLNFIEDHLCNLTGSFSPLCRTVISSFGPQILKLLANDVDPEKVCELIGMCTNSSTSSIKPHVVRKVEIKKQPEVKNPITCELCTIVLTAAKALVAKNESEEKVLQFIEKNLCARLGSLNATCVNFLETEGKQILDDLANGLNASVVCQKFGLCMTPPPRVQENPIYCTICQYAVQFLDAELKGNKTEAAVVNALENVCKVVPASLKNECQSLINTYGVYLVQLLVEFADPLKVCQAVKLCD